jgi:DNA-directed RNA polymerase specialized sigma24 family protein
VEGVTLEDLREQVPRMIDYSAAKTHARYREFIDVEDLVQEGWLWAQSNQRTIDRMLVGERVAPKRFISELLTVMKKAAEAAKAVASGYSPRDSYWYQTTVIEMVLTELMQTPVLTAREHEDRMPTTDPSHGNNWPVIVADVVTAWKKADLPPMTRTVLGQRYGCSLTQEAIAELTNQSRTTVQRQIDTGLALIAAHLNKTVDILHAAGCRIDAPERGELEEDE